MKRNYNLFSGEYIKSTLIYNRLTIFGFKYIDILLKSHNKKIEVINLVDSDKEDLIQDFVSVITSFCARIYGQRRSKRKTEKLIKELEDESKEDS